MSEERSHCTVCEKKIEKNKFNDKKKLSAVVDRAMLIVHENQRGT
jgi:hypothetical protein